MGLCLDCQGHPLPTDHPEGYFDVYGDAWIRGHVRIQLDGVELIDDQFEVEAVWAFQAGQRGWVAVYDDVDGSRALCSRCERMSGKALATRLRRGVVTCQFDETAEMLARMAIG